MFHSDCLFVRVSASACVIGGLMRFVAVALRLAAALLIRASVHLITFAWRTSLGSPKTLSLALQSNIALPLATFSHLCRHHLHLLIYLGLIIIYSVAECCFVAIPCPLPLKMDPSVILAPMRQAGVNSSSHATAHPNGLMRK